MRRIIVVWLCIMMVASSAIVMVGVEDGVVEGKVFVKDGVTNTTHAPIRINGNGDFGIGINGVSAGDGSAGNPWIIEGWDINGTGFGYCLYVGNTTDYFEVRDCSLHDVDGDWSFPAFRTSGLLLYNVTNAEIVYNEINSNNKYGIILYDTDNNTVSHNNISNNDYGGIYVDYSYTNTISDNNLSMNYGYGIYLDYSNYNHLSNNTASSIIGISGMGISLYRSNSNKMIFNNVSNNQFAGIRIYSSSNSNLVENNTMVHTGIGIEDSSFNTVRNNSLYTIYYLDEISISLLYSDNNSVQNNLLSGSYGGPAIISVSQSNNNSIFDNTILSSNRDYSIEVSSSLGINLYNNTMIMGGIGMWGQLIDYWTSHSIDSSNTLNGKPVLYWVGRADDTAPTGNGQIILANCTNITIKDVSSCITMGFSTDSTIDNLTISSVYNGMCFYWSDNNTITNNIIFDSWYGMILGWVNNNSVTNNTIYDSMTGIHMRTSHNNTLKGNLLFDNIGSISLMLCNNDTIEENSLIRGSSGITFYVYSSDIVIEDNLIANIQNAIDIYYSKFAIIINNTFVNCNTGIDIGSASYNVGSQIYHNNFFNTNGNVDTQPDNFWDNGYPSGGNYRSNYIGIDEFSGPNQDIPGSDGISDTPYFQDNYPLMEPWQMKPVFNIDSGFTYDGIQAAIDDPNTENGHTIEVKPGEYNENIIIDKQLTLKGEHRNTTLIIGNGSGTVVSILSNLVEVSGFNISNGNHGVVLVDTISNTINDNIIQASDICLGLYSSNYSVVSNNNVSDGNHGLWFDEANNNQVTNNQIYANSLSGIWLGGLSEGSNYNKIYHNSFIDNLAYDYGQNNSWDDGYPSGGNNWSDYSGIDLFSGPNQDLLGCDNFGDTPYTNIQGSSGALDHYPITAPTLTPHLPIRINSNADFDEAHGIVNWDTGDGSSSNPWIIEGWEINGTGVGNCIYIGNTTDYFIVRDCYLHDANGNDASYYFLDTGLVLYKAFDGLVTNVTSWNNDQYGICLWAADDNVLDNNNCTYNEYGVYFWASEFNVISNNSISNNTYAMTFLSYSKNNIIDANYLVNNTWGSIEISETNMGPMNCIVKNNYILNSWYGISSGWVGGNLMRNNTIINCRWGISMSTSSNTVENNTIKNSIGGISMGKGWNNIANNTIITEFGIFNSYGISFANSVCVRLVNNNMTNTGIYIQGDELDEWNTHTIDTTNKINGKSVHYWANETGGTLPPDAGLVILANCNGVTVSNQNMSNSTIGIQVGYSSGSILINNEFFQNSIAGIHTRDSDQGVIANNTAKSNYDGFKISGADNIIRNNNLIENECGLDLHWKFNQIYHNNFINNVEHTDVFGWLNEWDNGYPSGGNYWSNYTGIDSFSGANQDIPGSDGIGDTNFTIDDGMLNTYCADEYPLMHPLSFMEIAPSINLMTPSNNSYLSPGTSIIFYVWDGNSNLNTVNYSINGGLTQSFLINYNINTTGWLAGSYIIEVNANDTEGNNASKWFNLTIDNTIPFISLNSPVNNTIITSGTIIDLDVTDNNLDTVTYSINIFPGVQIISPFDIDTTFWPDDVYTIRIDAVDLAGNHAVEIYEFIIDTTAPFVDAGPDTAANGTYRQNATVNDPASGISSYLWSQESGPGTITFNPNNLEDPLIGADVEGSYVCRLTVTDNASNSAYDEFTLIWDTTNPIVDAGSDIIANTQFTQDATVNDLLSGISSYSWTKISGPGNITFGTPNSEDTAISANVDGTYIIRLTVTDNASNIAYDEFTLTWDTTAPIVDAGSDNNANAQFTQDATVTDLLSGVDSCSWSQESGPGNITFGTPNAEDTTISANSEGTYIIRLAVTDLAGNTAYDEFTLIWDIANPIVDAGTDVIVNDQYTQNATVSDATSGIASYLWTQESGLGTVAFTSDNIEDPQISADTDGTYIIRLTVTDNAGNSNYDEFTLIWDATSPNVDSGSDIIVNAQFTQDATAMDSLSGISSYSWTKISGPGTITFVTPNSEDTAISANVDGIYIIRLTVTDNASNIAYDEFTLTWDTTAPIVDAGSDNNANAQFTQDATVTDLLSGVDSCSWSQESGPGNITFGTPNAEDTTISANSEGTYIIRLAVTDLAGNTAYDEFTLIWDIANPIVDAGTDVIVNDQYTQNATVSDATSGIASYLWTQESGLGTVAFTSDNIEDPQISADTDGTYIIRLTVTDNAGNSNYDEFTLIWDATSPNVDSGSDIIVNAQFTQDATAMDSLSGISSYSWTKISGPGTITFVTPNSEDTAISANVDGIYIIRLTVTDNASNIAYDEFTLTWDTTAPIVDAGSDNNANAQFTQDATVTDLLSGVDSCSWSQESGPGNITFGTPNAEDTTISANSEGTYIIRLAVTDLAGNTAYDEFTLIWDIANPIVDAGTDATVNAPYILDATASDATSGIATYQWTQESGPGNITFGSPNAEDTTISADTDGTYIIRLTVTDNAGNSAFDEFELTWDATSPNVDSGLDNIANAQYTQNATVSDTTSGIATYLWTQEFGPGNITFGTPDTEDTNLSADVDGIYIIRLTVTDNVGNIAFDEFELIWDTVEPNININKPTNNSLIIAGTILDLNVIDLYLNGVSYTINGNDPIILSAPFDIDTTSWADGVHVIKVVANDIAGNNFTRSFTFTIDSTAPIITLISPANNSIILPGTILEFSVLEDHLAFVNYSINGEPNQTFDISYSINTTGWMDGNYIIETLAVDILGHESRESFIFTIDSTAPTVRTTSPWINEENIPINTTIFIQFNEAMDKNSVELAFSLSPYINISDYHWIDNRTLEITLAEDLSYSMVYTLSIGTNATDVLGNPLVLPYYSSFFTMLDTDGDGIPDETDPDDDNDGTPDIDDDLPLDPTETTDTDNDGTGDNTDIDDDGDGTPDNEDEFPLDENEWEDTDGDGIGNNADLDDDGDEVPDHIDADPLDPDITDIIDDVSDDVLPDDSPTNYWWLLLLMAAIVILSLLFFMRKKPEEVDELEPELEA